MTNKRFTFADAKTKIKELEAKLISVEAVKNKFDEIKKNMARKLWSLFYTRAINQFYT